MSDATIRPAERGDIAAVGGIYAEAVKNGTVTFETDPPDEAEMARRLHALLKGNYPYLVGELDGVVAGYAYAGPFHARPAYRWTVEDSIISRRHSSAAAWVGSCSRASLPMPSCAGSVR